MDFRILGPLEARAGGEPVALGGDKQRALLALLLLHANEALSSDRLIHELWSGERPPGAAKTLQVHVSRLRKALGRADLVVTREHGYELRLDPVQLDAHRFERRLAEGRSELAGARPGRAAEALEAGLAEWRGRPLDDLAYEPFAQRAIARLDDLRVAASEQLIEAKLALGRHAEVLADLETLIGEHPHREGLRAQLMLALYRCDRQAEALQAYQDTRRSLVEELGLEPGSRLRELEQAILAQSPALAAPAVDAPAEPAAGPPAAPAARRLVSVVFADMGGAGEGLDPEALHGLLARCADVCSAVIARHGGTVAPSSGEAIVGVFGQLAVHEDDALRAARAAVELREAGTGLGIRLGVESGEVFVGAGAPRVRSATGQAFAVAARLARAASPAEILLGDGIHRMLRGAVRAERGPDGQAWRLLALEAGGEAIARTSARPFVGRRRELEQLRTAFARVRDERRCAALTVVGPAGIGKSRLAQELVGAVADAATVVVGRCPSYGDGLTYRPLAEVVGRLGGADPRQWVGELFDDEEPIAQMVLTAIGLSDGTAQAEETFWAVRRMFERVAQDRPLVVVVEDIHWAESTLLDLLEYVVAVSSGHALLLLCLARPELLETRPAWTAPAPNRSLLVLDALSDADAHRLVAHGGGLGSAAAARIVRRAEGNPLFLEHLAAMGAESGEEAALPSSIQAVLAARIDHLAPGERALVEEASVQGQSFHADALEAILPGGGRAGISAHLVALVHKQLILAERSDLPGSDAFRFAHALIREAAYRSLPKQRRAELHERVARWLEAQPGVQDETIGYHLGEAYRHRAELGRTGPGELALAAAAAERLATAADAALLRGDPSAGAHLLEHAATLLDADDAARCELLPALGAALFEAGRMDDAALVLDRAVARAPEPRLRTRAEVERELVRLETELGSGTDRARRVADAALPVLREAGDELGQCRVWLLRGQLAWHAGRAADADEAWRSAARTAAGRRELFDVIGWRATAAVLGPTPVDEAIRRCEAYRALVDASPLATASTLNPLALLHAMKGEFGIAAGLLDQAGETLRELGGFGAGVSHLAASVRLLAGQAERAEELLRGDVERLSAMSDGGALATTTALLAQAVFAQGRMDDALALCRMTDRRAAAEDIATQMIWRGVQARIVARAGRHDEAEALARAAVAVVEPTDLLSHRGDAMLALADVLRIAGRPAEADRATQAGVALYERKGNAAAVALAR